MKISLELIAERGVRGFSLAQASRRLGVAPSAPYAHFPNREALLAEIAIRGCEIFSLQLAGIQAPPLDRLAAYVALFVTFAAQQPATFEVLYQAGLDKRRHPRLQEAEGKIAKIFESTLAELEPDVQDVSDLSAAIEATARGHAAQLLDSRDDNIPHNAEPAARRAAQTVRALIRGWHAT